ncbi:MAG TPA: response regulator [Planctomycetota bacterium]|nr:response regulator [Planctomycetota bacterium]
MPVRRSVLIVEDDANLRSVLEEFFRSRGWEATGAADGLAGFRAASLGSFDLVTMDIMMPGVNGVESLRSMALTGQGAKVVVISGCVDDQVEAECREAGALAVVRKPVRLAALGELVDGLIPPKTAPGSP